VLKRDGPRTRIMVSTPFARIHVHRHRHQRHRHRRHPPSALTLHQEAFMANHNLISPPEKREFTLSLKDYQVLSRTHIQTSFNTSFVWNTLIF
jgi:hypothetical protein